MASVYNKFDAAVEWLCGPANVVGVGGTTAHRLGAYLSAVLPDSALHAVKADLPEISLGNGYTGPIPLVNASMRLAGGILQVEATSQLLTAVGGPIGPFQYLVLIDLDLAAIPLIAWFDYGVPITLFANESLQILVEGHAVGAVGELFRVS